MNMFDRFRRNSEAADLDKSEVDEEPKPSEDILDQEGVVDHEADVENLSGDGVSPNQGIVEVVDQETVEEVGLRYTEEQDSKSDDQDEEKEEIEGGADEHDKEIVGVVGSRRYGRHEENPKSVNQKWKRGDQHRGTHKPKHKDHRHHQIDE